MIKKETKKQSFRENIILINGDCIEEMQKLIDEGVRVDMILTDPPYLMNYHTGRIKDKTHDFRTPIANDTNFELIADVMPLLYRLLKMGGGILYVLQ